jgi:hypothetical protein
MLVQICEPYPGREDFRDIRLFSSRISEMAAKSGERGAFLILSSIKRV